LIPLHDALPIWTQYVQARLVFMHGGDHALDQRFEGFTILLRTTDDLVVDVGDIAYIGDVIAAMTQPARHHVERHHYPRVTDMAEVIDGHAAHVHAHLIAHQRRESVLGLAQGVVDRQRHVRLPRSRAESRCD